MTKSGKREPATDIMKVVAAKTMGTSGNKKIEKVFTPLEIEEILARRGAGETLGQAEHKAIAAEQRRLKKTRQGNGEG